MALNGVRSLLRLLLVKRLNLPRLLDLIWLGVGMMHLMRVLVMINTRWILLLVVLLSMQLRMRLMIEVLLLLMMMRRSLLHLNLFQAFLGGQLGRRVEVFLCFCQICLRLQLKL